jgi:hypothetical protein
VSRHLGIGAINLRLVQASLDDGDLGIVGYNEVRHTADRSKRASVRADPIAKRLCPGRLDIGEVRSAHDRDEDLRRARLSGQPIDDHRHGVAGIINKQFIAAQVGLAHGDGELAFPDAVEFAEP